MKTFNVFYDVKIADGVLEERCLTVHGVRFKNEAVCIFLEKAPKNAILRSVKKPLDLV